MHQAEAIDSGGSERPREERFTNARNPLARPEQVVLAQGVEP